MVNTDETKTSSEPDAFSRRIDTISTNVRQLFKAIVDQVHAETENGADPVPALAAAMSLIETALIGIAEIADASQRLAAVTEQDFKQATIDNERARAEAVAEASKKSSQERNFIGKRS